MAVSQIIPMDTAVARDLLLIRTALLDRMAPDLPDGVQEVAPVCYVEVAEEGLRLTVEVVWV